MEADKLVIDDHEKRIKKLEKSNELLQEQLKTMLRIVSHNSSAIDNTSETIKILSEHLFSS